MSSNAERQAAYKERMRKAGFQQVTVWIQPERKEILINFAKTLAQTKAVYHNEEHAEIWCFPDK